MSDAADLPPPATKPAAAIGKFFTAGKKPVANADAAKKAEQRMAKLAEFKARQEKAAAEKAATAAVSAANFAAAEQVCEPCVVAGSAVAEVDPLDAFMQVS